MGDYIPDNSLQSPSSDERKTYGQWVNSTKCTMPGGGQVQGTPPPNMANLGDIITDLQKQLNMFASMYAIVVAIIQVIMCIIDILCALTNPVALIKAIIKLFGVCIPELILVIPQLAVLAYIICMVKIMIAIITYILTILIPLIQNIIANLINLTEAIDDEDDDALAAIAFKVSSLIKELLNLLGILAPLEAIIEIIKALLGMAISWPPCGDDDPCCDAAVCPDPLKKYYLDGYDGALTTYNTGGSTYKTWFVTGTKLTDMITLSDFFPNDADISSVKKTSEVPYVLEIPKGGANYVVTDILSNGIAEIQELTPTSYADGYLSSVYNLGGIPTTISVNGQYTRFGSASATFTASDVNNYVIILDSNNLTNAGMWKITEVYDSKNVKLDGTVASAWTSSASLNPSSKILVWSKSPKDITGSSFKLNINHAILMKHSIISVACHPAVAQVKATTNARFPAPSVPTLPDISSSLKCLDDCSKPLVGIDADDIIADPDGISTKVSTAGTCISNCLNTLNNDMKKLASDVCPDLVDLENSLFSAIPSIQVIGNKVKVLVTPIDKYGGTLGQGLPSGTIKVELFTTLGKIGTVTEEVDSNSDITGVYSTTLSSDIKGFAKVSAKVGGNFLNEFNGTQLNTRFVDVRFVDVRDHIGDDSTEPMGEGANG